MRIAIVPIGYEGDCGSLVAASLLPSFPDPSDRLLLGVGANQAAVVLQHKRAEWSLRQSHLRYRMVARAANDAIWDWDLVTNQVSWNEGLRTLFGHAPERVGRDSNWWRSASTRRTGSAWSGASPRWSPAARNSGGTSIASGGPMAPMRT